MGRLTEHLRSEGICKGSDYELQGNDAKRESSPGDVTSQVAGFKVGPDGPLMKPGSTGLTGSLKSRVGPESI